MFNTDPFKNYPQPPKPIVWKSPPAPRQPQDPQELVKLRKSIAGYIKRYREQGYHDIADDLERLLDN